MYWLLYRLKVRCSELFGITTTVNCSFRHESCSNRLPKTKLVYKTISKKNLQKAYFVSIPFVFNIDKSKVLHRLFFFNNYFKLRNWCQLGSKESWSISNILILYVHGFISKVQNAIYHICLHCSWFFLRVQTWQTIACFLFTVSNNECLKVWWLLLKFAKVIFLVVWFLFFRYVVTI